MTTKSGQSVTRTIKKRVTEDLIPVVKEFGGLHLAQREVVQDKTRMAPAFYVGWQQGTDRVAGFSLYTLMKEIPGHPQWSTVSGKTLEAAGFRPPPRRVGPQNGRN